MQQSSMLNLNTHISLNTKIQAVIILIARKRKKMFQNMKMRITENKANQKFTIEKYFSRKMLIFPDFPDMQPKFPDNSLIFQ